jgi:hypothetical protein
VANHRIEELIVNLSPHFDWILIDSPPVLAVTDAVDLPAPPMRFCWLRAEQARLTMSLSARRPPSATRASSALCSMTSKTLRAADITTTTTAGRKPAAGARPRKGSRKTGMIRILNVYYPTRTLVLLLCEALLVVAHFCWPPRTSLGRIHISR